MEWKVVKCQDVIDIRDGTHDTPKYVNVGYPLITSKNLKNGSIDFSEVSYISAEDYIEINKRSKVDKGDILLAMIGTIGNPVIVDVDQEFSIKNVALFKLQNSPVDPRFFKYLLESSIVKKQLERETKGGTQKFVSLKVLRNLEIPLPPIASQRRIANILDKADEIIRKRKEAIALTEQLQKSIFLDMFGDPVTNPKGWEKVTVNDVVSEVKDGPHVSPEYSHNGIPILSTRNIRPNELIMEDIKYISEDVYLNLIKRFKPQKGDVLLTKGGTTGFAKVVDWDWNFAVWVHLALLRPNNKIRSEFLEATLNSPNCYLQSQLYTHGIANKDLGLNRIRKIKMCLPPLDLQDEYCQIRKKTLFLLNKNKKSLKESENLFNSLLQKAFKGEL